MAVYSNTRMDDFQSADPRRTLEGESGLSIGRNTMQTTAGSSGIGSVDSPPGDPVGPPEVPEPEGKVKTPTPWLVEIPPPEVPKPELPPPGVSPLGEIVAGRTGDAYTGIGGTEGQAKGDYASYNAQGVAGALKGQAGIQSGVSAIDAAADRSTVSGQLSKLLDSNSAYIKQAEQAGTAQAAGRGMLNSSAAAGSARRAAIEAAMPIAQQDAQTYAQSIAAGKQAEYMQNQTQTEGIVSGELSQQNAAIAQTQQNIANSFKAQMAGATEANQVLLQDMQNQHQNFVNKSDQDFQQVLQDQQVSAQKADSIRTQASEIMQNYQISVENMMTDPTTLNLGPEAVNNAINQMQQLARNSINFLGAASGIDLTGFVDRFLPDISVMLPEE